MQGRWKAAAILYAVCLGGCGGYSQRANIERVAPVSGTLTFQGKPLEFHQVMFAPEDGRRPAMGVTDAMGKFTLGTNKPDDGAPPGLNKVTIVWVGPPPKNDPGNEVIIEDVSKLPKPKIRIPAKYGNPETSGLTQDVPSGGLSDLKIDLK
ncbi:MAG TPA: hypothetical protein VFB80_10305 [Pirellulaceae bacterium]|nr:hypothetical protein [Pirellulaceae bacterium]